MALIILAASIFIAGLYASYRFGRNSVLQGRELDSVEEEDNWFAEGDSFKRHSSRNSIPIPPRRDLPNQLDQIIGYDEPKGAA